MIKHAFTRDKAKSITSALCLYVTKNAGAGVFSNQFWIATLHYFKTFFFCLFSKNVCTFEAFPEHWSFKQLRMQNATQPGTWTGGGLRNWSPPPPKKSKLCFSMFFFFVCFNWFKYKNFRSLRSRFLPFDLLLKAFLIIIFFLISKKFRSPRSRCFFFLNLLSCRVYEHQNPSSLWTLRIYEGIRHLYFTCTYHSLN